MRSPCLAIGLVLLALVAGCTGVPGSASNDPAPDGATAVTPEALADEPRPRASPSNGTTPTRKHQLTAGDPQRTGATPATLPPRNPWGTETIVVNVTGEGATTNRRRSLVGDALRYWEANDEHYGAYQVNYSLQPDAPRAALVIRFVPEVSGCGTRHPTGTAIGCAPRLEPDAVPPQPTVVSIRSGERDQATLLALKHELGHVLGIAHGEPPMPLMARSNLHTKAAPWDRSNVTVAVDDTAVPPTDSETVDAQVDHALGYYASGADGTLSNHVSFTRVAQPTDANIVIVLNETIPQNEAAYSTMRTVSGQVADVPYRRGTIRIYDVDPEATGWHVGYWVGFLLGADTEYDLPPPFRTDDPDDRRSAWWR